MKPKYLNKTNTIVLVQRVTILHVELGTIQLERVIGDIFTLDVNVPDVITTVDKSVFHFNGLVQTEICRYWHEVIPWKVEF